MRISRGDRRARGDGDPVAAVPGDHADHRRADRGHPAVRDRAAVVVLRDAAHRHRSSTASRPAPTTTTSTCSCRPATCSGRFGKVLVFAVVVILIHCYYGYHATGGPAGVGVAVGRAVRTSIVAINVIDFFLSPGDLGHHDDGEAGGMSMSDSPSEPQGAAASCSSRCSLLGVYLTYGVFTKKFTDYAEVTLRDLEDRPPAAHARRREDPRRASSARSSTSTPTRDGAVLTLGIYPDKLDTIPANVTGSIVPQDAVRREVRLARGARRRARRARSGPAPSSTAPRSRSRSRRCSPTSTRCCAR